MYELASKLTRPPSLSPGPGRENHSPLFSVRMRAAEGGPHEDGGRHISGAERIVPAAQLNPTLEQLLKRAQSHERGAPDFINLRIEQLKPEAIQYASTLSVTTLTVQDYQEGRQVINLILEELGLKSTVGARTISLISNKSSTDRGLYGAWLLDAGTGRLLEPVRGVRVSRMDLAEITRSDLAAQLTQFGLNNNHVLEALALASKVMLHPASIAEVCWSDDPHYVTGYVACRCFGYLRIPYLKPAGLDIGGRVFIVRATDLNQYLHFLTDQPVLFTEAAPVNPPVNWADWLAKTRRRPVY